MSDIDENFCQCIEQAIETLHHLTDVLKNLDENLARLMPPGASAPELQTIQEEAGGAESNESGVRSRRQSKIAGSGSTTGNSDGVQSPRQSVRNSVRNSAQNSGQNSGRNSARNSGQNSARNSVRNSQIQSESQRQSQIGSPSPEESTAENVNENISLRNSRMSSGFPTADDSGLSQFPIGNGQDESRSSQFRRADDKSTATQGRMTMFIERFENYVDEMAEKIDTLNNRVVALGYLSPEDSVSK